MNIAALVTRFSNACEQCSKIRSPCQHLWRDWSGNVSSGYTKWGMNTRHMVKLPPPAPVAQRIERRPPEPKAAVRVCPGVFDRKEPPTDDVEGFLSMIRFENKGKLGDLPI